MNQRCTQRNEVKLCRGWIADLLGKSVATVGRILNRQRAAGTITTRCVQLTRGRANQQLLLTPGQAVEVHRLDEALRQALGTVAGRGQPWARPGQNRTVRADRPSKSAPHAGSKSAPPYLKKCASPPSKSAPQHQDQSLGLKKTEQENVERFSGVLNPDRQQATSTSTSSLTREETAPPASAAVRSTHPPQPTMALGPISRDPLLANRPLTAQSAWALLRTHGAWPTATLDDAQPFTAWRTMGALATALLNVGHPRDLLTSTTATA